MSGFTDTNSIVGFEVEITSGKYSGMTGLVTGSGSDDQHFIVSINEAGVEEEFHVNDLSVQE